MRVFLCAVAVVVVLFFAPVLRVSSRAASCSFVLGEGA